MEYKDFNTLEWLNLDDADLAPIRIDVLDLIGRTYEQYNQERPKTFPDPENIVGYGLQPEKQKFQREKYPRKLNIIEEKIRSRPHLSRETTRSRELDTMNMFWKELNDNQEKYSEEIKWIKKQWFYRLFGYWFYCNGKPTYITGVHHFYLNHWYLDESLPEYRDRDRRWFLAQKFAEVDTTTFKNFDDKGKAIIGDDGYFEIEETNRRVCFGTNNPKSRRVGDTSKAQCDHTEFATRTQDCHIGIQGKDDDNARNVFNHHFMKPFKKLPIIFKPLFTQMDPKTAQEFKSEEINMGLETTVDFATTSDRSAYDGYKLKRYHRDEPGKCLVFNESVLLSNGEKIKVQDIKVGDKLMGPDSVDREVTELLRGKAQTYKIIPNKGDPWECTGDHLLVLRICSTRGNTNWVKDTIKIMSVNEYLQQSQSVKKHVNLIRTEVEFPEKEHELDPYLLGLWLGDGTRSAPVICNVDIEVIDYLNKWCEDRNMKCMPDNDRGVSLYCGLKIHNNRSRNQNPLTKSLHDLNIYQNKHIPQEYLSDSKYNRLKLLAGLLDSDGSLSTKGGGYYYEITQKRKELSEQILHLALSLGFYASLRSKRATMKRGNKSIYKCEVYRVSIYGKKLYEIPCLVKRKQITDQTYAKNSKSRNPKYSGFKVEKSIVQDYYGFNVEGDGLFLLHDFTIMHNCKAEDINKSHMVVKRCLSLGDKIIGTMKYTTTVDEMNQRGGERFLKLTQDSHYNQRNLNGQTTSGLYNIFFRASDGMESFVGPYGESIEDDPTPEQAKFLKKKIGAKEFIMNERNQEEAKGDIEKLSELKRLFPLTFRECFTPPAANVFFRNDILEKRIQELQFDLKLTRNGYFNWESERFGRVAWIDDENGPWKCSKVFKQGDTNRFMLMDGIKFPQDQNVGVISVDPFRLEKTDGGRMSNGGIAAFWKRDEQIDGDDKDINEWESNRYIFTYSDRPDTTDEFVEQVLMCAIYTGFMVYSENNVDVVNVKLKDWGFSGYLLYDTDPLTGKYKNNPGFFTSESAKIKMFNKMRDHIKFHGHRERHDDLLLECLRIPNRDKMTDFDLFTAAAGALLGVDSQQGNYMSEENDSVDISGWLPTYDY